MPATSQAATFNLPFDQNGGESTRLNIVSWEAASNARTRLSKQFYLFSFRIPRIINRLLTIIQYLFLEVRRISISRILIPTGFS
jgi:hypothetical protein